MKPKRIERVLLLFELICFACIPVHMLLSWDSVQWRLVIILLALGVLSTLLRKFVYPALHPPRP